VCFIGVVLIVICPVEVDGGEATEVSQIVDIVVGQGNAKGPEPRLTLVGSDRCAQRLKWLNPDADLLAAQ